MKQQKTKTNGQSKNTMAQKIAIGATGVAVTAGVVAAGAALADKQTREKIGKSLNQGAKVIQDAMKEQTKTGKTKNTNSKQIATSKKSSSKKKLNKKGNDRMEQPMVSA